MPKNGSKSNMSSTLEKAKEVKLRSVSPALEDVKKLESTSSLSHKISCRLETRQLLDNTRKSLEKVKKTITLH